MNNFIDNITKIDCLEGLKQLSNQSIDIIITSPPYNIGNVHHTGRKKHYPYQDDMDEQNYQNWQIQVLNECYRVLKDDGSMFYNHKNRIKNGRQISPYEWIFKTPFITKQEIVWINGTSNFINIRFYPFTERVYWLTKNNKTKLINTIRHTEVFNINEWQPVGTKGVHTRAFPERMVEDILECFPNAQIVLDPFAGSGTTLYVAKTKDKHFIGFENNEKYVQLAKERIKQAGKQQKLFKQKFFEQSLF